MVSFFRYSSSLIRFVVSFSRQARRVSSGFRSTKTHVAPCAWLVCVLTYTFLLICLSAFFRQARRVSSGFRSAKTHVAPCAWLVCVLTYTFSLIRFYISIAFCRGQLSSPWRPMVAATNYYIYALARQWYISEKVYDLDGARRKNCMQFFQLPDCAHFFVIYLDEYNTIFKTTVVCPLCMARLLPYIFIYVP